jgi:SRSO17 transposase
VETTKDLVTAAGDSVDAESWLAEFDAGFAAIAGRFRRVEPRRQARAFLLGLMSDVDSRSCWQLAEQAGYRSPHSIQRLLGEEVWDADGVRDDVRRYVVDELGDSGAVLILDDTGDLKAGIHTIGVQRQYTGTAGRIENAQVAVFLAYASRHGYTLILPHLPAHAPSEVDHPGGSARPARTCFSGWDLRRSRLAAASVVALPFPLSRVCG